MEDGEKFNTVSHLVGALLALVGGVVLVAVAASSGDRWKIVSFSIYALTLVLMYSFSALYHNASHRGRAKLILRTLDHNSIYLLIAGSYTPFSLVSLRGPWGWSLFGALWVLALLGIVQELWRRRKEARALSMVISLLMGWGALVTAKPLLEALSWAGFSWLLAGGLVYTIGIVFYAYEGKIAHSHGIWHLFVVAGSSLHYVAVLRYVA